MALVAFDLDKTLGYFKHVSPWGDFFSVETLENSFNRSINPGFTIAPSLRKKLRKAETLFIETVLHNKDILQTLLRPNVGSLLRPLIRAKNTKKVRAVCIYSNTWSTGTLILAKRLLETIYDCPGFFDATIDATHPVRAHDWATIDHDEPIKTFRVLRDIFRNECGVKGSIEPRDVLFVDEREHLHSIYADVLHGLTYLKPTPFSPVISDEIKENVFMAGLAAMDTSGLFSDREYLDSQIFHCNKFARDNTTFKLDGIFQLLELAELYIRKAGSNPVVFNNDSASCKRTIAKYLLKF
jgi:hypothetical protein